uniref:UvrD-like helicase C-terminal domain-containing protein n=1 Tax=Minutocellus polymorphus TaxID=265543 RepID=A0A7S0AUS5_9STRA|mmetsp:Transcript_4419/g.7555  ORF Transcript_4419/g.7555 Transcript_4419/m.7555 type:complete len:220 (+) Transcript_4419:97-756(+)
MNNMVLIEDFHDRHGEDENASIGATLEEIRRNWIRNWRKEQEDEEIPDIDRFNGVVLATCHAAKGLEFNNVYLYDDFGFDTLMKIQEYVSSHYLKEMLNLVYVAITRAKKKLFLSTKAKEFMSWASAREKGEESDRGWEDMDGEEECGTQFDSEAEDDLERARELLEEEWDQFLERHDSAVESLEDVPLPKGPKNNEFALCSSMSISEQRSSIKTYLLR